MSHRRAVLIAALALGLMARGAAAAREDGMARGNPKAKVTVVEYASVGCPHCGAWARNVWPEFRARYVDSGRVRFILREVITGDATLATAGFLTARCAGKDRYFQVIDAIFAEQEGFFATPGAYDRLLAIAKAAGLTEERFRACLDDDAAKAALGARSERAAEAGIDATPTFLVNGAKVEASLEALSAAIAKAGPPVRRR